jgi:serine kinase of HPr protein (carbohydrate metabolism regulator)
MGMSLAVAPVAMRVHATAVAFGARCVLIRGKSGSGKSDLALALLALSPDALAAFGHGPLAAALIADDQVQLARIGGTIRASAPKTIEGLLEVRGVGIVRVPRVLSSAEVALVVDPVPAEEAPRLPDPGVAADLLGIAVPRLALDLTVPTAALKVALALHAGVGGTP